MQKLHRISKERVWPEASNLDLFPLRLERFLSRICCGIFIELVDGLISECFDPPLSVVKAFTENGGDELFGFYGAKMIKQTAHASFDDLCSVIICH